MCRGPFLLRGRGRAVLSRFPAYQENGATFLRGWRRMEHHMIRPVKIFRFVLLLPACGDEDSPFCFNVRRHGIIGYPCQPDFSLIMTPPSFRGTPLREH
jgi:hypothetical protein